MDADRHNTYSQGAIRSARQIHFYIPSFWSYSNLLHQKQLRMMFQKTTELILLSTSHPAFALVDTHSHHFPRTRAGAYLTFQRGSSVMLQKVNLRKPRQTAPHLTCKALVSSWHRCVCMHVCLSIHTCWGIATITGRNPFGARFGKGEAEALSPFDKGSFLANPNSYFRMPHYFLHLTSSTGFICNRSRFY